MGNVRKTGGRDELDAIWNILNGLVYARFSVEDDPGIGDGTTDGKLRTNAAVDFAIDGLKYTKASTDDLWDLSAQTDTGEAEYKAYWLYLSTAGAASIAAGTAASTAALALKALPALDTTKSVIGVYVAGPETDFNGAAGLAAQGTIYDGVPAGVPGLTAVPSLTTLVAP